MYFLIISILFTNLLLADCCNDDCFKLEGSKDYCAVVTNDVQILDTGTIENATVRSKTVIESEIVDGDVVVLNGAEFNDVTVNGELILNGVPFVPGNTNFATFTTDSLDPIDDNAIVPFNDEGEASAGIILNADGSFTLVNAGIYVINFYLMLNSDLSAFAISPIPAAEGTKLPNTTFARTGSDLPLNGYTIIQTTLPNTTLGIQNVSNGVQNPDSFGLNITAAVQIFRIG
jgi:hypothetical protein